MPSRPKKVLIVEPVYVDEKGASVIMDIALPTLRKWRHEGKPPRYMKIDRMCRYEISELHKFMNDHKVDVEG